MSRSPITVGSLKKLWDAKHIGAGAGYLFWVTSDGRLCRAAIKNEKPAGDIETLSTSWPYVPFAIVDGHVVVLESQGDLRLYTADSGFTRGRVVPALDVKATYLAGTEKFLYFSDQAHTLRRVALEDGVAFGNASIVSDQWKARHFAVSGDRICWLDDGKRLWLGRLEDGRLSSEREVVSDNWNSRIFTGHGDQLFWRDVKGGLKRAKKLAGNGNYIHFRNEGLAWDSIDEGIYPLTANVRGPGEGGYYNTQLRQSSPTGVPYEPKHQDYWYSVEYSAYFKDPGDPHGGYFIRAYMSKGNYFKDDQKNKVAVLRRKEGEKPNGFIVDIEDM